MTDKQTGAPRRAGSKGTKVDAPPGAAPPMGGTPVAPPELQALTAAEKAAIMDSIEQMEEWAEKRQEANAKIRALREGLVTRIGNRLATDLVLRYHKATEEQRQGHDRAMLRLRDAIGHPMQTSLNLSPADEGGSATGDPAGGEDVRH